jgi:hypothetical protein
VCVLGGIKWILHTELPNIFSGFPFDFRQHCNYIYLSPGPTYFPMFLTVLCNPEALNILNVTVTITIIKAVKECVNKNKPSKRQ